MKKKASMLLALVALILSFGFMKNEVRANFSVADNVKVVVNNQKVNFERKPVVVNNRVLLPAKEMIEILGGNISWFKSKGYFKMIYENKEIYMGINNYEATIGNNKKWMDSYPVLYNEMVMMPARFTMDAFGVDISWEGSTQTIYISNKKSLSSFSKNNKQKKYVVVVDPGHGGYESGAHYYGTKEKDLNLSISKKLKTALEKNGIKVYMTRDWDKSVSLYARSDLARRVNADMLVSVHNNAGYSSSHGTMTLYHPNTYNKNGTLTSKKLATIVQGELTLKLSTKNYGIVARPNLAVIRTSNVPAIIAEVGYMSNYSELTKLRNDYYQSLAAEGLKNGILKALKYTKD